MWLLLIFIVIIILLLLFISLLLLLLFINPFYCDLFFFLLLSLSLSFSLFLFKYKIVLQNFMAFDLVTMNIVMHASNSTIYAGKKNLTKEASTANMICNGKHCPILSNDVGSSISIQFRHKNGRKDETVCKEKR